MKWLIVGADVGGTNTDVVCLHGTEVIAYDKVPTTEDVTTGLRTAIQNVLAKLSNDEWSVARVNIGTTHFVNALVQRCQLVPVSVVRLCGPATRSLGPFDDFPEDLHELIKAKYFYCNGGYQVDGSLITDVDEKEILAVIKEIKESEIRSVVISGVFSPVNDSQEKKVQQLFTDHFPEASVTISSDIGSIGFLERENAAILNESLKPLCHLTVSALSQALTDLQLECPFFLTQNDGTIISSSQALNFPVKTFSCGPTNSMRGACHLSGIKDAIVVDIGGTTTDVGSLQGGFPRPSSTRVTVGGVDTNFRMPDVLSIGLGGGSIVKHKTVVDRVKVEVGPKSVGYRLTEEALIFGGSTVTASDIAVAYLKAELGDRRKVKLSPTILEEANEEIQCMIEEAIDQMKVSKEAVPVILVGAGSILRDVNRKMKGVTKFILPPYYQVANAVGAALGQVSGYEDKPTNMTGLDRKEALDIAEKKAVERCLNNGARKDSIQILEREEINLAYLPGNFTRIKVKAVGDLSEEALLKAANDKPTTLRYADPQKIKFRELSNDILDKLKKDEASIVKAPTIDAKTGDWLLSKYDILCVSIGAGILGCGGGGSPRIGRLRTETELKMGKEIRVIHPRRLTMKPFKGGKVGVAGFMGAPGVSVEKVCSGQEVAQSLEVLHKVLKSGIGTKNSEQRNKVIVQKDDGIEYVTDFDPSSLEETVGADAGIVALMSAEIGGCNAMEPLCVAALLGVPVLDCDGMGRAFPELQMFAPAIYNNALYPAALVDEKDQRELILWAENSKAVENHFRKTLGKMGCSAAVTFSPLDEEAVSESCIMFSISRCFRLGDAIVRAQKEKADPIHSICEHEGGVHLITGKVVDVCRKTTGGFDRGYVEIEGTGKHSGQEMVINFQNENLIATRRQDGKEKIVATTPDLIVIVDSDAGTPVTTEEVRYGLRVAAIVLPSPPQLRTETALKVVGPRAFKYDVDFTPIGDYQFKEPIPVAP
ncbi:hypothetical protein HOLleu_07117 [Holothuria leucospilota]|uniref:Hydantoinase n=1 Tax=Holothuria leucospilota TaxID=206669 RepID=A0A9Q1HFE2_HOLLE|nr:hypothetical protein HOLleu_07117 [Holothuria leucospilota]